MRAIALLSCAGLLGFALAGCSSTIDQAKKIAAKGEHAFAHSEGTVVTKLDRHIQILATGIVTGGGGTAAIVELRNMGAEPVAGAPIAINVTSPAGVSLFRNNAPGGEFALSHVPLLRPHATVDWVNDQVLITGHAARVSARVGTGKAMHAPEPKLVLGPTKLSHDPVSGWVASGKIRNASHVTQVTLVLYAVARKGKRIVAAGRATLPRLPAGASLPFHAYFIGDPNGASVTITAPPSVLG